jgi:hypothetical protein
MSNQFDAVVLAVVLAGVAVAANAHEDTVGAPPAPPDVAWTPHAAPLLGVQGSHGTETMLFMASELGGRGIVQGAPYSATAVSEARQTLADGNRITHSTTIKLYRDGQGRTRQEQASGSVFINDGVAGKRYVLNTQTKTMRELPAARTFDTPLPPVPPEPPIPPVPAMAPSPPPAPAPKPPANMSAEEARSWAESMRTWGREFAARMRGEPAIVDRDIKVVVRRHGAEAGADVVTERVEVLRFGGPDGAPHGPLLLPALPSEPGVTTSLGSRTFDGVRADGSRTTWTIPAGRIGNEKPIEIFSERWYSPELMLVVMTRHADPRSGERIYRLEGIKRDEPPAELFKVPSDYAVRGSRR